LASYGMDAVRDLRIVASASDAGFGQIHAEIDGYGIVPLADGAVGPLKVLKDRIAQDCGLEGHGQRIAEWSGPLHG